MNTVKSKKCSICTKDKEVEQFSPSKSGKFGCHSVCKKCRTEYEKGRRNGNFKSLLAQRRLNFASVGYKICSNCGLEKQFNDFYKDRRMCSGYRSQCRSCISTDHSTRWNPDLFRLKTYGLSAEDFTRLLKEQNGRCGICSGPLKDKLNVDHCHTSGQVRGLLCTQCNLLLGLLERPNYLANVLVYLRQE